MPWHLAFPFSTVDERVAAREAISLLRHDPNVTGIRPTYVRGERFTVFVDFREGADRPADQAVYDRTWGHQLVQEAPPREEPVGRRLGSTIRGALESLREPRPRPDEPIHTPPEVREQTISEYIRTSEGRTQLAASMIAPLRQRMDYSSVGRRTFLVDQLPDGALPVYDRDPQPAKLPDWLQPGVFACCEGRVVEIKAVNDGFVRVSTAYADWADNEEEFQANLFSLVWKPCDKPPEPLSVWDRLQGDDLL